MIDTERMNNQVKKKVLITGVAGFIGSNLADRLLSEGFDAIHNNNLGVPHSLDSN